MSITRFIVTGAHITENLQHHKKGDVERILEDKGFSGMPAEDGICIYAKEGTPDSPKRTEINFDDKGFVLPGHEGVRLQE